MNYLISFILTINICYGDTFLRKIKSLVEKDPQYIEQESQNDFQEEIFKQVKTTLFLPDLSLDLSKGLRKSVGDFDDSDYSSYNFNASYTLSNFGADWANYKAGKHALNAYQYGKNLVLQEREKFILDKAFQYIYERNRSRIYTDITELKRKTFQVSKQKFKRGALSKSDFLRVKIDYSNARVDGVSSQSQLVELKNELSAYGVDIKFIRDFPWKGFLLKPQLLGKIIRESKKEIKNPRIDFYQSEHQKFEQRTKVEKRKFWGDISLGYTRSFFEAESNSDGYSWQGALTYTFPLFSNFSDKVAIYKARASSLLAKANYDYYKRLTEGETKSLLKQFKFSLENLSLTESTLVDSKSLLKSSYARFRSGKISVNDMLTEQDQLIKTKLLSNTSLLNIHKSFVQIMHNFGYVLTGKNFSKKFF